MSMENQFQRLLFQDRITNFELSGASGAFIGITANFACFATFVDKIPNFGISK
jgi:hypothetical protein